MEAYWGGIICGVKCWLTGSVSFLSPLNFATFWSPIPTKSERQRNSGDMTNCSIVSRRRIEPPPLVFIKNPFSHNETWPRSQFMSEVWWQTMEKSESPWEIRMSVSCHTPPWPALAHTHTCIHTTQRHRLSWQEPGEIHPFLFVGYMASCPISLHATSTQRCTYSYTNEIITIIPNCDGRPRNFESNCSPGLCSLTVW